MQPQKLHLNFSLNFRDLYSFKGLTKIDHIFLDFLKNKDSLLYQQLCEVRQASGNNCPHDQSKLIIALGPILEGFICSLFHIDIKSETQNHIDFQCIAVAKKKFIQRVALKQFADHQIVQFSEQELTKKLEDLIEPKFSERKLAKSICNWMDEKNEDNLYIAAQFCALKTYQYQRKTLSKNTVLFAFPQKLDFENLVPLEKHSIENHYILQKPIEETLHRDSFSLTDEGMSLDEVLNQAHYCIFCHERGKDSCSKGLKPKFQTENQGKFQKNDLNIALTGCPLEEKISEMNVLKSKGYFLAAFATILIDNPMVAATGHRICNDCMKACIYQKQDPVDIPQIETQILKQILALPWGFEIYSLLIKWNPLHFLQPLPAPPTQKAILIAGLGPAGFTLSHYLLRQGHQIVAIDGLKIEPLLGSYTAKNERGVPQDFQPIFNIADIYEDLDDRIIAGFGGVAEYGITVRWNKNFLKIIRLLLERQKAFSMIGGVRLGGTLTIQQAFDMGFDHVALCLGAGKPKILNIPNNLAKGVRQASDFLMNLQLSGSSKKSSLANLELRLPIIVIGGGLTAIDTATEALAYYPRQVEKFLHRYETLCTAAKKDVFFDIWPDPESQEIAKEFIAHGQIIRQERILAKKEKRAPHFLTFLNEWGGATIAYRKNLQDAPSYRLNHEEVDLAFREGLRFAEKLSPKSIEINQYGQCENICFSLQENHPEKGWQDTNYIVTLPAKSILIAAGTQPNTVLFEESNNMLKRDGFYFQALSEQGEKVAQEGGNAKPDQAGFFIYHHPDKRTVSYFGDLHPSFAGNVVKAMGSVKYAIPYIEDNLKNINIPKNIDDIHRKSYQELRCHVETITRLGNNIIEITIKAPAAARAFQPGQFYRLQNFEALAQKVQNTSLAFEGLAMTGAWVDKKIGLISVIILEMGGSSSLCSHLKENEPIILMGPTGTPTEIVENQTILLLGGGLGNAVLFSIGKALKGKNCRVLYFAAYKKNSDRFKIEDILSASDQIVWCCDEEPTFSPSRKQDIVFHGNIAQALLSYGNNVSLHKESIPLSAVNRVITIGSDQMMAALSHHIQNDLSSYFRKDIKLIASINSPMQCMMKEICAQCLQKHIDPKTGQERIVFSCSNQDQDLLSVDFQCLKQRLSVNRTSEKLTAHWIDYVLQNK